MAGDAYDALLLAAETDRDAALAEAKRFRDDSQLLGEVRGWLDVEPGKPVLKTLWAVQEAAKERDAALGRVAELEARICQAPGEVERVCNSIGWVSPGAIDCSKRINEAIDMLRAQAVCISELEAAAKPIDLSDAPRDGSPVIVETSTGRVLLVHWHRDTEQWESQGARLTDISLTKLCRPISPWAESKEGGA